MGLFSFLTSKGGAVSDAATDQAAPPADSHVSSPSPDGPSEIAPGPEAAGATPSAETPFVPPDVWGSGGLNVGALTAPSTSGTGDQPQVGPADPALTAELQGPIIEVIKTVFDPEIPVDVYELGLIYDVIVDAERRVLIRMTLTSPACPSAQQLPSEVRYKVKAVEGVSDAAVEIVWEPPWDKDRMSDAAKLQLGSF